MSANLDECEKAGLNPKDVDRIASGLARYAKQAHALGVHVFGGSGSGTLRFDDGEGRPLIVGHIYDGIFDGGDGAECEDGDGLMRGE